MAFAPYQTHTGLLIHVDEEEVGEDRVEFSVCITGTSTKELLTTPDREAADKYAEEIKAEYEARKAAEVGV